jgi:hypothetical protein
MIADANLNFCTVNRPMLQITAVRSKRYGVSVEEQLKSLIGRYMNQQNGRLGRVKLEKEPQKCRVPNGSIRMPDPRTQLRRMPHDTPGIRVMEHG